MGILSISHSSTFLTKLLKLHENNVCRKTTTNVVVFCHQGGGGNVIKSSNLSSVITERTPLVTSTDHGATTLMDAGSLVLSQNADIVVKDMVSYGGTTSTPLIGLDEGIGIVKFLRGKKFFVTGATGFLAKGNLPKHCIIIL